MSGREADEGSEGPQIVELAFDACEVIARRDWAEGLRRAFAAGFGLALPAAGRHAEAGGLRALGLGPDAWMILAAPARPGALEARLRRMCGATATIVDTGHGLGFLAISGEGARGALARICRLDLDPARFAPDACARTVMAQIPATIWRQAGDESYALAVPASFAQSYRHSLATACRLFGAPRKSSRNHAT